MGLLRPEAWFHSIIKQTVSFCEIYNIDSYHIRKIIGVHHLKIKPLEIAAAICIISNPDIVFDHGSLPHLVDVAAFKF
jgi:hypothetical protein